MEWTYTVLLVLGFCCAVGSVPQFDPIDVAAIGQALQEAEEADGLSDTPDQTRRLGILKCTETDSNNPAPKISKVVDGDTFITINPVGRQFTTVSLLPLDYEVINDGSDQQNRKKITIRCEGQDAVADFDTFLVLNDLNDNRPVFQRINGSYSVEIDELLNPNEIPKLIYSDQSPNPIIVTDADGTENNVVTAECVSLLLDNREKVPCDGYFSVKEVFRGFGSYTFEIRAEQYNFTRRKSFNIEIRAVNVGPARTLYSITQNVAINIKDVQNLPPQLNQDGLSFQMYENAPQGTILAGYIEAFDQDVGDPHPIQFELVPPILDDPSDQYAYNNDFYMLGNIFLDGSVYKVPLVLKNPVDREAVEERTKTLYLGVKAIEYDPQNRTDRQKGTAEGTISITILDVNDQTPQFSERVYNVNITESNDVDANPENFKQISNNLEIAVTDSDSEAFNAFTVDIISGNNNGDFKLDHTTGNGLGIFNLYARQKILDYEVLPNNYVLQMEARDVENPTFVSTSTVTITITDSNDNSPLFPEDTLLISILEDTSVGTTIGSVTATDRDSGNFGRISEYVIIGDDSNTFSIDLQGRITLVKPVDFEQRDAYFFAVVAYDSDQVNRRRDGSINVNIQIINKNDVGPLFTTAYSAQLFEDQTILTPAIVVEAESREAGVTNIEYFISGVSPNTIPMSSFNLNRLTGNLTVTQFINYDLTSDDAKGIVRVNVTAQSGDLSSYTIVVIRIIDVNNYSPEFVPTVADNTYYAELLELAPAGFTVIDLNVTDRDGPDNENGIVTFQILRGASDDFLITADSGIIKVTNSANLDIESNQRQYRIVVLARDKGRPPFSSSATVVVTLLDANNKNPVFDDALYRFQMKADDPVNKLIGTVVAQDSDSDSRLNYSIDYRTVNFEKQYQTVPELIEAEKVIKIDAATGDIRVAGTINREKYDRINFYAIVEDINIDRAIQARQTASASVVIFINAAEDESIYFVDEDWSKDSPYINITLPERKNSNTILTLKATDPSIPETVDLYRKVPSSDPLDYFRVVGRYVENQKPLDYEDLPQNKRLSVVVEALSSNGLKTGTATIVVTVQDLNDNQPVFDEPLGGYRFTVAEDKRSPYIVGRVKATDSDSTSYGQVEYFIPGNQTQFDFYPERSGSDNEAVIIVAQGANLDFETQKLYNLQIIAVDNPGGPNNVRFTSGVDVFIEIEDVNDQSPVFDEPVYNVTIIGTADQGSEVFIIKATDGDAGRNGEVSYSIDDKQNPGYEFFDVETIQQQRDSSGKRINVGRLFVKSSLQNLPDRQMYTLTVSARDNGEAFTPAGTCKVIITVSKGVQDLKPKWDENLPANVSIYENLPAGTLVATLIAYPKDVNSGIIYSFIGAGDALRDFDSFQINPNTGAITTKVPLDYEDQIVYSLLVLATDKDNDTLTNQYLLIVKVLDVDDNQPSFADCPGRKYTVPELAYMDEEREAPVNVYQARACDLDDAPHNQVKYSWFVDNDQCKDYTQMFDLNEDTGLIITKVKLDRETQEKYMLCVEASRPNLPNVEDDINSLRDSDKLLFVELNVRDVNDIGPKFYEPEIKTVILQYPPADVSVAEAYDPDLPPNNDIRYSIDSIYFTIGGKTQDAPTAFTVNAYDGTINIGNNDYTDYIGGYFDITVKAEDYNGAKVPYDTQLQRVYVTSRSNRIRVVFDEPAGDVVNKKANNMIDELNTLYEDAGMYYEIESISYHVVSNNADPSFDRTDVCMVLVENDGVLSSVGASKRLTEVENIRGILNKYGAVDPGSCDPAVSVYPVGWESYWWVLVAFAIFIFVCCLILIFLICVLFRQYKQYMDSRQTYLVPGN